MEIHLLSKQLKTRRKQIGLSLPELARRADTSPATLSRYENGWGRFELYTLRKLATALRARLVVRIEPLSRPQTHVRRADAARQLRRLFWERDLRHADIEKYPDWILERVLEYGSLEDVRLLIDLMGRRAFLDRVRRAKLPTAKTRDFWRQMIEREGLPCTRERSPRTAWDF